MTISQNGSENPKLKGAEYDENTPAVTSQEATDMVNAKINEEEE